MGKNAPVNFVMGQEFNKIMAVKKKKKKQVAGGPELRKLCPLADNVSLTSLLMAITRKYKFFLTADASILSQTETLKKMYNINVITSLYDLSEDERMKFYATK